MGRSQAIQKAIDDCMRQNVLEAKETGIAIGKLEGIAIGEAKALDLMAKGYSLEQIKDMLKS